MISAGNGKQSSYLGEDAQDFGAIWRRPLRQRLVLSMESLWRRSCHSSIVMKMRSLLGAGPGKNLISTVNDQ